MYFDFGGQWEFCCCFSLHAHLNGHLSPWNIWEKAAHRKIKLLNFNGLKYKVMVLDTQQATGAERVLYRAWEKGLNIVLALKSKEATLLLFLLSSLFCTLSLFIRFALRLIFNGALGAKEMSVLWIHTHTHTLTRTHLGIRAPSERRQVHPKGLANSNTGGAKFLCALGPLTSFLPLTLPEDGLPRCNWTRWFLYTHYLWPFFVFHFLVLRLCLFVSFRRGVE